MSFLSCSCLALAHTAFEDTYLTILDVDGPEWADFLRYRMNDDINERLNTEQSWLLSSKERFNDLMQGKTVFKRESELNARVAKEHELHVKQEEAAAAARKAEKSKKKIKLKNPLRISPRHSHKN